MDRHVAPLGHIFVISSRPVFVLTSKCCVRSREVTNTNFIVVDLNKQSSSLEASKQPCITNAGKQLSHNDVGLGDYRIETNILTISNFFVRLMINLCQTLDQIGFLLIYHYSGITLNEYKVMEKSKRC
jgi:hypothetical protein